MEVCDPRARRRHKVRVCGGIDTDPAVIQILDQIGKDTEK